MTKLSTFVLCMCLIWIKCSHCIDVEIKPSCPASETVCRFNWTITQLESMVLYKNGRGIPIVYRNGSFQKRLSYNVFENATSEELQETNMVDGVQRFIYTINNQMPGPTIVVYENQEIEVTLTNGMLHEATGIHWHGQFNKGTPFMDGVPGVTQCNINPSETFVYRFKAEPYGTHLYHSHMGVQRLDGLFGGLIVLRQDESDQLPQFNKDFLFMLHDWYPHVASSELYHFTTNTFQYVDGFNVSEVSFSQNSTCINGRGYLYDGDTPLIPVPPVIYAVTKGGVYRFRFIHTGNFNPYKVHIDQHKMWVIATDGSPVVPFETDYIVLYAGERYDVYIQADQPVDNYWIRVENIYKEEQPAPAVLRYEGAPEQLSSSKHTPCTPADNCEVVNCPFSQFPNDALNLDCVNIGNISSIDKKDVLSSKEQHKLEEHFFFVGESVAVDGVRRHAVNGIHFILPSVPPQLSEEGDFAHYCDQYDCDSQPCQCTNVVKVTPGNVVQMVIAAATEFTGHPMHLHGHNFQVLKVVYGEKGRNIHPDIRCFSNELDRCTSPHWTHPSWAGGNVPGINTRNPPEKDTIIVPTGGYVVVRFKANNPGWWLFHCHIDFHFATGMGVLIQEGETTDMPVSPVGFPTCGSFLFDQGFPVHEVETAREESAIPSQSTKTWTYVVSSLGIFLAGFLFSTLVSSLQKQYQKKNCKVDATEKSDLLNKCENCKNFGAIKT